MTLPLLLVPLAAKATIVVVTANEIKEIKDTNDSIKLAKNRHEINVSKFEKARDITLESIGELSKLEIKILNSLIREFSDTFEKIKNAPKFEAYSKNGVNIPEYDYEKIKEISIGARTILVGITAGTVLLGTTTIGMGLLIGGVTTKFISKKLSEKEDEAWNQMKKAEEKINTICKYLLDLRIVSNNYYITLYKVNSIYELHLSKLKHIVYNLNHRDWRTFTIEEKRTVENTVLLVGLLYNMCKVELVLKSDNDDELNTINENEVKTSIENAEKVLEDRF